jgi:4-carboxymuconolactone decarboxylase
MAQPPARSDPDGVGVVQWAEQVTAAQYALPVTSVDSQPPPAAARGMFGDIAPKLAQLTDEVLYGDVWARPGLSPRDRSLVTVSALIAMNRPDQLRSHMARARDNGVTEDELVETITHLAFYAGWPSAVTAIEVAREVFKQDDL